jgi:prolyl oligopeptidase
VDVSCPDARSNRCLVSIGTWNEPTTRYDFDARTGAFSKSVLNADVSYPGFDQLVSEEVEVPGHDGTMVPLSIIHRKGIVLDGSASCILLGYGAYGISTPPRFSILRSVAARGVVFAIAHVRGGGEKGEAWHRAGYKATKPNTWKDFISCGEFLIRKGYTSAARLAGSGTSAGGILISRAITERPDLFAAAVCNVGDADAMRSEFGTDGPANSREYGTVKDPVECQALYEMDGVQHVQPGVRYPAVLGVGGWNDPRVAPWQPGKFVAALQNATASGKPVLMVVNFDSGHFTEDKRVAFRNFANQMAFLLWQTGHEDFQPAK